MHTIRINADKGYDVTIGSGLLKTCGPLAASAVRPGRAAVVTDQTVAQLYLGAVEESLCSAGFAVSSYAFPPGETSKNITTLSDILEFLAENRLDRADCVIALGGGVVGDSAGFAAGCYLRGIRYIQIPTTLLAAVDSSVGGKTAIDLAAGKNLAGLFLQPEAVICDTDCMKTLPEAVFADGAAEAIKTGVLSDESLFSIFETTDVKARADEVISRCVAFKGSVVEADPFEAGLRKTLNLGHTAGHAIEKLSGYTVTHGFAVAVGIAVIARASDRLGLSEAPCARRITETLTKNGLPTTCAYSAKELAAAAMADKKRSGGSITLIIPRRIGACYLKEIAVSELESVFAAGLEEDL